MISVGNNKAVICKGDFHPAALYKGDKKIAGYTVEEFESENGVTLENCYNDKLHNAQIIGNTVQDGTPTPETPVEVQSVGELVTEGEYAGKYKIPVRARGKNLYKPTRLSAKSIKTSTASVYLSNDYGTTISTTDATKGEFTVIQSTSASSGATDDFNNGFFCFEIEQGILAVGKAYIISFDCEILNSLIGTNKISIYPNGSGPVSSFYVANGRIAAKFLYGASSSDNYLEFRIAGKSLKISNIMITDENGTSVFDPYIEPQTFNIYLDEPLRKVGDYADYVDFVKRVVVRRIAERAIKSISPWYKQSDHSDYNTGVVLSRYEAVVTNKRIFAGGWAVKGDLLCNGLKHTRYNIDGIIDKSISERQADSGGKQIRILTSEYATTSGMLAAFGEFKVSYILDEPYITEEPIDLPELPTFKGTTIYEIDTEIPATISGKYKKVEA